MPRWILALALIVCALPAWAQTIINYPTLTQPTGAQVTTLRVQNTTGGNMSPGYVTTMGGDGAAYSAGVGIVFKKGDVPAAEFTGSIAGTTLTVPGAVTGTIAVNQILYLDGAANGTEITIASGSGTTWTLSSSPGTVASRKMSTVTSLTCNIGGTQQYAQLDPKAFWPSDGSVEHAILTWKTQANPLANNGTEECIVTKAAHTGGAAPPTAAPSAATVAGFADLATTAYTGDFSETQHCTGNGGSNILAASNTAVKTIAWLSGPAVNTYVANGSIFGGQMRQWCIIAAFSGGTAADTLTTIVYDNSWMFTGGKSAHAYNTAVTSSVTVGSTCNQAISTHGLYRMWACWGTQGANIIGPNIQRDTPYFQATGAIPNIWDASIGVMLVDGFINSSIGQRTIDSDLAASGLQPLTAAQGGSGNIMVTDWTSATGGSRPELGPQPNWMAQQIMTQHVDAQKLMMRVAMAGGTVGLHFFDETRTPLKPLDPNNCTNIEHFGDGAGGGTCNVSGTVLPANGWGTAAGVITWPIASDHQADLNYVPYLLTGDYYQLLLFEAQDTWSLYAITNWAGATDRGGLGHAAQGVRLGFFSDCDGCGNQTRAMVWAGKQVCEGAFAVPDQDALKNTLVSECQVGMNGGVQEFLVDGVNFRHGNFAGFDEGDFGVGANATTIVMLMNSYAVMMLGEVANFDIPQASANALILLDYFGGYVTGGITGGVVGNDPIFHCVYWKQINFEPTPDSVAGHSGISNPFSNTVWPLVNWNRFANQRAEVGWDPNSGPVNAPPQSASTNGGLAGGDGAYPLHCAMSAATMTSALPAFSPGWMRAAMAFGLQAPQNYLDYALQGSGFLNNLGNNNRGGMRDWPFNTNAPRMPDGKQILFTSLANSTTNNPPTGWKIDTAGTVTVNLTATAATDSLLACMLPATTTCNLTGSANSGGYSILVGGWSGTSTLTAGAGENTIMVGRNSTHHGQTAAGTTTIVDGTGNSHMWGGDKAVFDFEVAGSGQDAIWDFNPGAHTLKVKQNLNGNGITTAAGLWAACSVSGSGPGDLVCGLDPGGGTTNKITLKNLGAVSSAVFQAAVTMVP